MRAFWQGLAAIGIIPLLLPGVGSALKGKALFGADALYHVEMEEWSSKSAPKKIPGTDGMEWPRFSPDGKLIAALKGSEAYVFFNDFSAITKVTGALQFNHPDESKAIEWVKTRDGSYELAYPRSRGVQSVTLQVDWAAKKITVGETRDIAKNIGTSTSKQGMDGGFDVVDMPNGNRHVLVRARYMAELHTQPDKNTPAQSSSAYSWPTKGNTSFYSGDHNKMYPHSCFHSLSHDGQWAQLMQNVHNDEWPGQKGDHLGFVLLPWQGPKKLGGESELAALPWVLYNTPSSLGSTEVRNYRWSNDPKVLVAANRAGGKFYLIELADYPPKATNKKNGEASWTEFTTSASKELWGVDIWVGALPGLEGGATALRGGLAESSWRMSTSGEGLRIEVPGAKGSVRLFDTGGRLVSRAELKGGMAQLRNPPETGLYLLRVPGRTAALPLVLGEE